MSYTNVDAKLKPICVKLFNSNDMKEGTVHKNFFRQWWTQMGKNNNIKELKNRLLDTLNSAGFKIDLDDIRLWLYSNNDTEKGEDLKKMVLNVKKGFDGQLEQEEELGEDIEKNSGV